MDKGYTQVFCGNGDGKSSAAIGKAVLRAALGESVIIIRFMKNQNSEEKNFFSRFEPEIRLFRFEKSEIGFQEMTEEQKAEETINVRNGLSYAKKVLATGECDVLVLDEVLGLVSGGMITAQEIRNVLDARSEETVVIMTGINLPEEVRTCVDIISKINDESE